MWKNGNNRDCSVETLRGSSTLTRKKLNGCGFVVRFRTQVVALGQDLPGHLEAPADVGVVGLRHHQLTDGDMRSMGRGGGMRTDKMDFPN